MTLYYISGSSRGIGKSLVELLLKEKDNHIVGFSRSKSIKHERFRHYPLDLNNLQDVDKVDFSLPSQNFNKVVLVNNAGVLGEIKHVGQLKTSSIEEMFKVNLIAPAILMNHFMGDLKSFTGEKLILNISSGASKSVYDGWAGYCSSKAGIDMFSRVIADEQQKESTGVRVFSVAPGVVDTAMQDQIRTSDKTSFSNLDRFVELKKSGSLSSSEVAAKKLKYILDHPDQFSEIVIDVRNIP